MPGRAPTEDELHELVRDTDPIGTAATFDLRTTTAYTGGEIGFYLRTDQATNGRSHQVYYSERAYQPDRDATNGFIHLLIYNSHVSARAFYFAWEDLFAGGDNDFEDLLVLVDNIVCTGGGAACNTHLPGVCAQGIQQCRAGSLTCVPTTMGSAEVCDGVDNDCDGMVDDGAEMCGRGRVCDRGACVERCVEGSCFEGQECTLQGTCVAQGCERISCDPGERCTEGRCVGLCENVVCPHGQTCRSGRCVDPCAELTCDTDQVCVAGRCEARCPCRRCGEGEACDPNGRCMTAGCSATSCGQGEYCERGTCIDACTGARCPTGQECAMGECRESPDAGVSVDASGNTNADSGVLPPRDGAVVPVRRGRAFG